MKNASREEKRAAALARKAGRNTLEGRAHRASQNLRVAAEHDEAAGEFRVMLGRYPGGRGIEGELEHWATALAYNEAEAARRRAIAAELLAA